jgi:hypothetical protein
MSDAGVHFARMSVRGRKILLFVAMGIGLAWVSFAGVTFHAMHRSPEAFGRFMSHLPMPALMLLPFETMWNVARGGALRVGDAAPDFDLRTVDGSGSVRLSSYRGSQPVVLVFGSYT